MQYAPNTDAQLKEMLCAIGASSFEELLSAIPEHLRQRSPAPSGVGRGLQVPPGLSELEVIELGEALAAKNQSVKELSSFLGAGAYAHMIPTVVDAISARGEWLTPYTPYQAEASQGTLQAIYEFQTMICELMGMDVANASMYDGATAAAEAALMSVRTTERPRVLISETVHPHARETVLTYVSDAKVTVQHIPSVDGVTDVEALGKSLRDDAACVIMQQPNVFGAIEPMAQASDMIHHAGGLFVASVYPVSLGILKPPGAYGADIAVGEGRCFGSPISSGGPGLGLFTATQALVRRMPGRLAGCTTDQAGARGYTLTLQTREQHIRREKATSNICTNEGWLALRATIFLSLLGPQGVREMAQRSLDNAHELHRRLRNLPWVQPVFDQPFFNEFAVRYDDGINVSRLHRKLAAKGIVAGFPLGTWYPNMRQASLWCATELTRNDAIDHLVETMKRIV